MKKTIQKVEKILWDMAHAGRKFYWRVFKIKTFGVRILLEHKGKFFLVRHRYGNLWVFPGGGMKRDENPSEAAKRELEEETNIELLERGRVLGVYRNSFEGKNDTVTVIVAKKWCDHGQRTNLEIKDFGWFSEDDLPKETSGATQRRIKEYRRGEKDLERNW